jgi:hypothetical protein
LLDRHITLEVECLYLNGYIGKLATGIGTIDIHALSIGDAGSRSGDARTGIGELP